MFSGYYRVNYDAQNWKLIIEYLTHKNFTNINPVNRAQLIDDSLNLARAGRLNYNIALALLDYLKNEVDYIPWVAAWHNIPYINKMLTNTEHSTAFKVFFR